jgi:preprotein translocase subunit SecA
VQIGGQFIDASPKQNLTEAAQDIQELLEQLSSTYSSNTSTEQMIVATKAVEVIEGNPMLKKKIINAIKAGGSEMLRELVKHPAINVLLAAFEGWNSQVDT